MSSEIDGINVAKHEPFVFYNNEPVTYECPNGHTIVIKEGAESKEDISWLRAFRGYCSSCESEWEEFVAEHKGHWEKILDENFPSDPTFFEWQAQRIADWHRLTTMPNPDDNLQNDYPREGNFGGMVPWVATDEI